MTTASAPGSSGRSRRRASTSSAAPPCSAPPPPATDPIVELFRAWIDGQHADLQFITSGFVVAVDGVAIRGDDGLVGWYPDLEAAERAAVKVMKDNEAVFALPWPVERHKAVLDEQLLWVAAVMADARRTWPVASVAERRRMALRGAIADLVGAS